MPCVRVALWFAIACCIAPGVRAERVVSGIPTVIDGDSLEIDDRQIRLHGIDAPEYSQQCVTSTGREWPCGRNAESALESIALGRGLRCEVRDTDRNGRAVAVCVRDDNVSINEWMVANGWAIAYTRYSRDYVDAQRTAKAAKRNIWSGTFTVPEKYRHEAASAATVKRRVDSGQCLIKGNISANGRIYHLPGSRSYAKTRISTAAGERWFCSEDEAVQAGWRAAASP